MNLNLSVERDPSKPQAGLELGHHEDLGDPSFQGPQRPQNHR